MPACFNPADLTIYFPSGIPIWGDEMDVVFKACCVIGSRDETTVIQWTTNHDVIHFAIVRLCNGVYKTVAVYIPEEGELPLIYEALVSPGQNQFLLRPNPVLCQRFMKDHYVSLPNNYVSVIDLEQGILKDPDVGQGPGTGQGHSQGQGEYENEHWYFREEDNCYEELEESSEPHSFGKCLHRADLFTDGHADEIVYSYDPRFPANRIAKVTQLIAQLFVRTEKSYSLMTNLPLFSERKLLRMNIGIVSLKSAFIQHN